MLGEFLLQFLLKNIVLFVVVIAGIIMIISLSNFINPRR